MALGLTWSLQINPKLAELSAEMPLEYAVGKPRTCMRIPRNKPEVKKVVRRPCKDGAVCWRGFFDLFPRAVQTGELGSAAAWPYETGLTKTLEPPYKSGSKNR